MKWEIHQARNALQMCIESKIITAMCKGAYDIAYLVHDELTTRQMKKWAIRIIRRRARLLMVPR